MQGEDKNSTIIDGSGVDSVVSIVVNDVKISGLKIQNSGEHGGNAGIEILSNYSYITDNIISNNTGSGIQLQKFSNNNTISSNIILNNRYAGIYILGFGHNIIDDNTISDNGYGNSRNGLYVGFGSNRNVISKNIISNNSGSGIYLKGTDNNTIFNNTIKNNRYYGVLIDEHNILIELGFADYIRIKESSENNTIYLNEFITNHLYKYNAYDECNNTWYNEDLELGNYWDDYDYTEWCDVNADGVADTPYNISGEDNQDKYPLIREGFVPGEIIVGFIGTLTNEEISSIIKPYNLSFSDLSRYSDPKFSTSVLMEVPINEEAYWIKIFKNEDNVDYAHLNGIVTSDDPVNLEEDSP